MSRNPNILFLDDDRLRITAFLRVFPFAQYVETAQDCIDKLADTGTLWDVVCLDHDLGGDIYVDPKHLNTGSEVVRWIQENRPEVGRFIVHSFNGGAAAEMCYDLQRSGYSAIRIPFNVKEMCSAIHVFSKDTE